MRNLSFEQLQMLKKDLERDVNTNEISKKYQLNFRDIANYRAFFNGERINSTKYDLYTNAKKLDALFKETGFSPVSNLILSQLKRLKT